MSDVFVSYSREDRSRVEGLVRLLEAQGFSVWWDRDIVPGESFDELIDKQIDQAAAVLVVWTKKSIDSRWVRNEALEGMDRGILVPVLLDDVRIPVAFRQAQLANLVRWPRQSDEAELRGLVEAIRSKVGRADADATYVSPPRGRLTITRLIAPIALAASIVLAVLLALYWQPATTPVDARKSVAVARFESPANDADRLLGDGISQELLRLLRISGVPVVHQDAMWTLPADLSPDDVLQRVGARFLVDGTLQVEGEGFVLTVTLTDGAADVELWRKEMRSSATDMFALNRQLAREIIASLGAPFEQVATASATVDREAYMAYLQGLRLSRQFGGLENLESARELLERSIEIDSTFGEAYAALCRTHLQIYGTTGDTGDFENAERYCHRALTLEGRDATIHLALGDLYAQSGQTVKATDQYDQALLLDAELADAYIGLGKVLAAAQEPVRAEQAFQQAVTRQPGYWQGFNDLGSFYVRAGRLVEAIEAYTRVTYLRPDNAWAFNNRGGARYFAGDLEGAIVDWERANALEPGPYMLSNIGTAYFHLRRLEDAAAKYREALDMNPNDHAIWGNLGDTYRVIPGRRDEAEGAYVRQLALANDNLKINRSNAEAHSRSAVSLAFMGRVAEARKSIEQAVELAPDNITVLYDAGVTYVTLGEFDHAVDVLKRAIDVGYSASFIDTDPLFDDLRSTARYTELVGDSSHL